VHRENEKPPIFSQVAKGTPKPQRYDLLKINDFGILGNPHQNTQQNIKVLTKKYR